MAAFEHNEEEEPEPEKSKNLVKVPTTLASVECLTFPLVQEVVLLADYQCKMCQDRVADIVSRLNGGEMESVEIRMMEKKVTLTLVSRYSRAVKRPGKEHEATPIYKNLINRIFDVRRFLCSSNR